MMDLRQKKDTSRDRSALESIEHQLYDPKSKNEVPTVHHTTQERTRTLPASWGEQDPLMIKKDQEKSISFGTKLLLVSTVILLIALGFSAWRVMSLRNVVSSSNIDMSVDITPYVEGGEETPLVFTLRNRNTATLESAYVTLLYKQGNGSQDEQEKKQEKRELGKVASGELKKQDFKVSLYGSESETRDITIKLEYKVLGSNAVFTKLISTQVILRTPPISVSVEGPEKLSIGQSGTYSFTIKNNSGTTSLASVLKLQLPNSFTIESSNPRPISRSTSWIIAPLPKGESQVITVVGSFDGKQGESGTFQAKVGSQGDSPSEIGIVYDSSTQDVLLRSSPLKLSMEFTSDTSSGDMIKYGDKIRLVITYVNTSLEPLEDVSIQVSLSGEAALYNSIDPTSGYYDSLAKTISWNKATLPDLLVLPPNGQGVIQIVVPIVAKGTNSPTLKVVVTGTGSSKASNDIIAMISKTYAVTGSATLVASTQYKTSSFGNTGPIPPRPNEDTTYTANFRVSAQNAISKTKVSFVLPTYVSWRNIASDQRVTYEPKTRTVSWNIGHMDQNTFVSADIGLSVRPSQSHVGQSPVITSGIVLDADEDVSLSHLKSTLSPLTTFIKNEVWGENPSLVVDR